MSVQSNVCFCIPKLVVKPEEEEVLALLPIYPFFCCKGFALYFRWHYLKLPAQAIPCSLAWVKPVEVRVHMQFCLFTYAEELSSRGCLFPLPRANIWMKSGPVDIYSRICAVTFSRVCWVLYKQSPFHCSPCHQSILAYILAETDGCC